MNCCKRDNGKKKQKLQKILTSITYKTKSCILIGLHQKYAFLQKEKYICNKKIGSEKRSISYIQGLY